jgi:hypothetical protein
MTTTTPDWNTVCSYHHLIGEGLQALRNAPTVSDRTFRFGKITGYANGLFAGGAITWNQLLDITLIAGDEYTR